jgi:hypothetical protein
VDDVEARDGYGYGHGAADDRDRGGGPWWTPRAPVAGPGAAADLTRPVPVREFPPLPGGARRVRTVNVGAVLGGLVLLAVAAWVGAREVTGSAWDWRWSAAGVLLLSGLCVVVAAVVSAVRQRDRSGDPR